MTALHKSSASVTLAALLALLPRAASASVDVQTLRPATNTTYTFTQDALLELNPRDRSWKGQRLFFSAQYGFVDDALVEYNSDRSQTVATLIDGIQTLDITGGVFLLKDLALNLSLPLNLVHVGDRAAQFGLGDARLQGKYKILGLEQSLVAIALIPELRLPSGDRDLLLSNGGWGAGLLIAGERDFGPIRAAANIGYRYNGSARFRDIDYRHQIPVSLAGYLPLASGTWGVNAELAGAVSVPFDRYNNPGEFHIGGRYQIAKDASMTTGVGLGNLGVGSNDVRVVVGVKFSPTP